MPITVECLLFPGGIVKPFGLPDGFSPDIVGPSASHVWYVFSTTALDRTPIDQNHDGHPHFSPKNAGLRRK
jgi:hypothetical protein